MSAANSLIILIVRLITNLHQSLAKPLCAIFTISHTFRCGNRRRRWVMRCAPSICIPVWRILRVLPGTIPCLPRATLSGIILQTKRCISLAESARPTMEKRLLTHTTCRTIWLMRKPALPSVWYFLRAACSRLSPKRAMQMLWSARCSTVY